MTEGLVDPKRPRTSEGGSKDVCPMDRSFDASGFIEANLLGPRAQEVLRDSDPVESVRWAKWAMLRAATILKSAEPCLTVAEVVQPEGRGRPQVGWGWLEDFTKEKDGEIERLKRREEEMASEVERLRGLVAEERVRADLFEVSISELQKQCEELTEDAKATILATERALKAQLVILAPDFDSSQISFFKDIVDGKVVDPSD
ncbi:hypothetical protein PIB30_062285 [Stylosanthes scabra]|uniref:Uncharacterized protein n=1 Tax=Stylosanthes scabra TaxID=79078 RepID=A0ABU6TLP4_9FABA|nr:hypothetical protein [Stylosanthes scabra]